MRRTFHCHLVELSGVRNCDGTVNRYPGIATARKMMSIGGQSLAPASDLRAPLSEQFTNSLHQGLILSLVDEGMPMNIVQNPRDGPSDPLSIFLPCSECLTRMLPSRFMPLSPINGWEGAPLYRPEVLFAMTTESTYLLLPWRGAVEIKPEPIEWTIVNGVKFAPLEFQYIQSHLYMNSVREAGVFRCVAGDTTYYEVELDYNAESLFRSVNRPYYAFNAEGRMSPSRREFDLGTEDDILEDLLSIDEFDIARSKPHQLPKPGSAYVGRQGSFRMALVFDGMGTVAFASLEGATDKIRYVRYYAVGTESGALVTVTYTTGGQAHFVMLLECENAGITQGDNLYYDVNTFYLWDDISFAMTVMAHEQPVTAILQPRGIRPPKSGFEGFVLGAGRPTLYHGREWLFGQGARNDEYSVAPIRPDRNYVIPFSDIEEALNKNMTIMQWAYASGRFARPYKFPAIRASIYHISPEGVTHYYEAFVDTFGMTKACFFGIHEWEYPLSDGQSEKPLRDRILDMDHPVTKDLNGLCERNVLLPRTGLEHIKGFKFGDLEPHSGNFTGFLENGTLRLEFEEAGAKAFEEGWLVQSYDKIAHYRVLHALIAAVYPTGSGEKDGRVLILRQPGTTMETYLDDLNARLPGGIRKMDLKGWDTA